MSTVTICPECGAQCPPATTCETHFHQMLFWEAEFPHYGIVHHLMVLCFHLQHPSLYSPAGLAAGIQLLTTFVRDGISPDDVRRSNRDKVNSLNRDWKITARPDSKGSYPHPIAWTMTAADVVARGSDHYCDSVREWAQRTYQSLTADNDSP